MAMKPSVLDTEKMQTFEKLMNGAIEFAQKHDLPLSIVEGKCRDIIANVEGYRLLQAFRAQGAKL